MLLPTNNRSLLDPNVHTNKHTVLAYTPQPPKRRDLWEYWLADMHMRRILDLGWLSVQTNLWPRMLCVKRSVQMPQSILVFIGRITVRLSGPKTWAW